MTVAARFKNCMVERGNLPVSVVADVLDALNDATQGARSVEILLGVVLHNWLKGAHATIEVANCSRQVSLTVALLVTPPQEEYRYKNSEYPPYGLVPSVVAVAHSGQLDNISESHIHNQNS